MPAKKKLTSDEPTMRERATLGTIEWGDSHFGGIVTNSQLRRRDVLRVVAKGWAKSNGLVYLCDDDGFLVQPERMRESFSLTDAGRAVIRAENARRRKGER